MLGSKIKLKTGAGIGSGVSAGSLKTASAISATLQTVTDTAGNNSALAISSAAVNIGSGTITNNGTLTIKGSGGNSLSVRNSSNVETNSISSNGLFFSNGIAWNSGGRVLPNGDGIIIFYNSGANNFNRIQLGGQTAAEPAISKNGAGISITDATGTARASLLAKDYTSDNLSSGTLTTARPIKFGDRATITEAGFIALGLNRQIAIEHNGVIYYIPVSTTLIP
jgi:hypothetical protein